MNNEKKFPLSVTGLYPPYNGSPNSQNLEVKVSPAVYDKLQEIKVGGKLYFKRAKDPKDGKPVAFLEYRTAEELEEIKNRLRKEEEESL